MNAKITYCVMWNYLPDAERVSAELKSKSVNVDLIKGSNGIFDVEINGKLVYSKCNTDRFPNRGELLTLIWKLILKFFAKTAEVALSSIQIKKNWQAVQLVGMNLI